MRLNGLTGANGFIQLLREMENLLVIGEEVMTKQAMLNIMKNAIEAMPHGGTLKILLRKDRLKHIVEISDTVTGMTKEQLERLGKPYYSTNGQKGTGIGLMVSFRIIEEMKGKIIVNSEPGKGTTFQIDFPAVPHNR
jgi:two-component system sporulation sensor kinase B